MFTNGMRREVDISTNEINWKVERRLLIQGRNETHLVMDPLARKGHG
jgi:hypothetical protein